MNTGRSPRAREPRKHTAAVRAAYVEVEWIREFGFSGGLGGRQIRSRVRGLPLQRSFRGRSRARGFGPNRNVAPSIRATGSPAGSFGAGASRVARSKNPAQAVFALRGETQPKRR